MTRIDRRQFLATSSAAALALAAGPALRADSKLQEEPFGGFKVGAQSYTFRKFDLEPALKRMKELGLKYGEFYQVHCPQTTDAKKIKAFLEK